MERPKNSRSVIAWFIGIVLVALAWAYRGPLSSALMPFFLAVFLAYLLNPLVDFLGERKVPRVLGILIIYLSVGAVIALLVTYTVPRIVYETTRLTERLPEFTALLTEFAADLEDRFHNSSIPPVLQDLIEENIAKSQARFIALLENSVDLLLDLFGKVFVALLTPILTFYILKDVFVIKQGISNMLPSKHRRKVLAWMSKIDATLGRWIRGQLMIAFMVGVLSSIGLSLIGLDFALLLGAVAGVLDVVPYFGPFIGGVPPVVVGLLISPAMGLKALAVIVVVQQIESNLITPQILGHSLGLHPLMVIFALLLGGELGGFLGLILSVPVAAVIKVTLEHIALGD